MNSAKKDSGAVGGTVPEALRIRGIAMGGKTNKRELILAAAQEVFFEKGYHSATSEEIAKRAGIGKGTIYQYFDSKPEIFLEMHRLYIEQYTEMLTDLLDDACSFEENLRRLVHFHITNMEELSRYAMRFLTDTPPAHVESGKSNEILNDVKRNVRKVLERLIDNGKQRGEIRDLDVRFVMCYLIGNFLGIAHLIGLEKATAEQKQQLEEDVMRTVLYGLSQPKVEA